MRRHRKSVQFVTRRGCTICEAALERLQGAARVLGVAVATVDVDADPALSERFGGRVPVVLHGDGVVISEGPLTRSDAWRAALKARR